MKGKLLNTSASWSIYFSLASQQFSTPIISKKFYNEKFYNFVSQMLFIFFMEKKKKKTMPFYNY